MKSFIIFCAFFVASCITARAQEWKDIAANFKSLPEQYRPIPLWFWNNTEITPAGIREQMQDLKRAGYGGVSILPFGKDFKPEYLSDAYFEIYRQSIEEADKLGMRLNIYDEYGFPSGTAGDINGDGIGRFKQKYPHLTNKRLDKTEFRPSSSTSFTTDVSEDALMALVAMDTLTDQRIDLTDSIENGKINWEVPHGSWKVMAFHCVDAGNSLMDYLDPEAADRYIEMTHEAYYERFSTFFGKAIEGTFFDEPTMYYAEGRTWTPNFNEKFEEEFGFSPTILYPALWYDIGERTVEARNYLHSFRAKLFAEGYIRHVDEWSQEHGIYATGHLDNEEIINPVGTSGDFMKTFKYLSAPGIDKIGGDRPAERFYKLISSAAYNWDKHLVMSETYGDMGDMSWDEIYGIAMDQYSKGINMLIPHAAWYNDQKVTFLPELSLRNPIYADGLEAFNAYLTRLNIVLRDEARWLGDIAILYPINSMQGDHYFDGPLGYYKGGVELPYLDYIDVGVNLFDSLGYDHMFLHPEVLDEQCEIEDQHLLLDNPRQHNAFSVIIVPASNSISLSNLKKIEQLAIQGGTVIFTGQLPEQATLRSHNQQVNQILRSMLARKNVHFIEDPTAKNLDSVLADRKIPLMLRFQENPIPVIHKERKGKRVLFLANPSEQTKSSSLELDGQFVFASLDPHSGEVIEDPHGVTQQGGITRITLSLEPFRSIFLIEK
ncbi:MAG: glycosyl hydrolase [Sphingobacterium sp.]